MYVGEEHRRSGCHGVGEETERLIDRLGIQVVGYPLPQHETCSTLYEPAAGQLFRKIVGAEHHGYVADMTRRRSVEACDRSLLGGLGVGVIHFEDLNGGHLRQTVGARIKASPKDEGLADRGEILTDGVVEQPSAGDDASADARPTMVDECLDRGAQRGYVAELGKNPVFGGKETNRQLVVRHSSVGSLTCRQRSEQGVLSCGSARSPRFHRPPPLSL